MTRVVESVREWMSLRVDHALEGKTLGLVPTMGNLHPGHLSLIQRSQAENDVSVASLFVNPTQFNDPRDLSTYPRTFREDLEAVRSVGLDYLFCPSAEELYPDQYRFRVTESDLSKLFCGEHRPGHFDGVLTVVLKLLLIIRPNRAYFGEKDYQQLLLIEEMARSFFLTCQVVPCPIIRDDDGLAFSSRNNLLTADARESARAFPRILAQAGSAQEIAARMEAAGLEVEYVGELGDRRVAAVRVGGVRLIDNVPLRPSGKAPG